MVGQRDLVELRDLAGQRDLAGGGVICLDCVTYFFHSRYSVSQTMVGSTLTDQVDLRLSCAYSTYMKIPSNAGLVYDSKRLLHLL